MRVTTSQNPRPSLGRLEDDSRLAHLAAAGTLESHISEYLPRLERTKASGA